MKTHQFVTLAQVDFFGIIVTYPVRTRGHYTYHDLREQLLLADSAPEAQIIMNYREEYSYDNRYALLPYTFPQKHKSYS